MTAYIANHQKKNRILKKMVHELERAVKNKINNDKIIKAAEIRLSGWLVYLAV